MAVPAVALLTAPGIVALDVAPGAVALDAAPGAVALYVVGWSADTSAWKVCALGQCCYGQMLPKRGLQE